MRTLNLLLCIILSSVLPSFAYTPISKCYISFANASNLTVGSTDQLPEASSRFRKVKTKEGEADVTRIDGYRILYNNNKNAPFVNLKVEQSEQDYYAKDQNNLLENMRYLVANSTNMETQNLTEYTVNGYKIYGFSRATIDNGSTLGTYIMFPGNGVAVYFYFNNLKPEYRQFENVEQYRKLRDKFLDEYTKYIASCK